MSKILGELKDKRTINSKHLLHEDGSITAMFSSGILHFHDENNQLHDVSTELHDEDNFDQLEIPVSKIKSSSFKAKKEIIKGLKDKIPGYTDPDSAFHVLTMPFDLTLPKKINKGYSIGHGSDRLTFKPVGSTNAAAEKIQGNVIKYAGVWDQTDVILEATDLGVKETIILKDPTAPTAFTFEVTGPLQDDLSAGSLKLAAAWLKDANGIERDVQQIIRRQGSKIFIDLFADTYDLSFPIEIDPTVTISTLSADVNVWSSNPDTNYSGSSQVWVGGTAGGYYEGLFQFSGMSALVGQKIVQATLEVFPGSISAAIDDWARIEVEAITSSWSETSVTWNTKPTYTDLGGRTTEFSNAGGWHLYDATKATQHFADGGSFFGYCLKTTSFAGGGAAYGYNSRENGSVDKPVLKVRYNAAPGAPVVTAPAAAAVLDTTHNITWTAATDPAETVIQVNNIDSGTIINASGRIGQTFTVPVDAKIKKISIAVSSNAALTVRLAEISGGIGSTVLESGAATFSAIPGGYLASYTLPTPRAVIAGTRYGVELADGSPVYVLGKIPGRSDNLENRYAGGGTYTSGEIRIEVEYDLQTPQSALVYQIDLSVNGGGSWSNILAASAAGALSQSHNFSGVTETTQAKIRVRAKDQFNIFGSYAESALFTVNHNMAPSAPTNLTPGGTSGSPEIVSSLTPTVSWIFNDGDSGDTQSAYQVRVYNTGGSIKYDSGKIISGSTSYVIPGAAALAWGTVYYYNVQTWDAANVASPISVSEYIMTNQGPVTTVTTPSGAAGGASATVFNDTTQPTVIWSYSDPEGNLQTSIQIQILDGAATIWDSGEIITTGTSYGIPGSAALVYDKDYKIQIRSKDNQGTWGAYSAIKYFHLNRSPNAPTNLSPAGTDLSPLVIQDSLTPTLSAIFSDPDPSDTLGNSKYQVYDGTTGAFLHDSGWQVSMSYLLPGGVLMSGKKYKWRVQTSDSHFQLGAWSADQYFYTNATPSTPINPAPAGASSGSPAILYDDLTPSLSWQFADANVGDTQAAFQVRLYNAAGTLLHDSGEIAGSVASYSIPQAYKLSYGVNFQWEVKTKDPYGAWSNYTSRGWIKVLVGAPVGLTAIPDNFGAKIALDWSDSSAESLSGYDVFRATVNGGPYTKINGSIVTSSQYADSAVIANTTYYYVVQAVVAGQPASANSAQVSASVVFSGWFIGDFKFEGPSKLSKKRSRIQSKRVVLGKSKQVIQDRGFVGEDLELEIFLVDDEYSTGAAKYAALLTEMEKTEAITVRDPFGRVWKVAPGEMSDEQLLTGKLEYMIKLNLTEVN